ncbi:MAG: hypothetical protein GXY03_15680, partial [Solirubrobacterales bacterium]|nr:hypothetical protein [Solirubrobacterales bacterium]
YRRLATAGLAYGPAFRLVRAAWRDGARTFAEIDLPGTHVAEACRHRIHPALLDAALQIAHPAATGGETGPALPALPFALGDIRLRAAGAKAVRAVADHAAAGATVALHDSDGRDVVAIGAIRTRPAERVVASSALSAEAPAASSDGPATGGARPPRLHETIWAPARAAAVGPTTAVIRLDSPGGRDPVASARSLVAEALAAIQA